MPPNGTGAVDAVNENLAHLSNWFMYSAIAVYVLAFFAFCAEWVFGGRSRVAQQSAALTAAQTAVAAPAPAVVEAAAEGGGGVALATRPVVVVRGGGHDSDAADDRGDVTGGDERSDRFGRVAVALTVVAFLMHFGTILTRGLAVKRAPWGNMYEFSTAVALMAVAAFLVTLMLRPVRWLGLFVVLPVMCTLGLAVGVLYTDSQQLVPALHSYWLWIHVSTAIVSFGALHIGALASLLFLFKDGYETRMKAAQPVRRKWDTMMERLPASVSLDKTAYRVNALIFPLWTFAVVAGAIWAEVAWGRYWGWDPKETWSFITWVAYAAYLHARATGGWKGRNAAYLSLVAFSCFLVNYYVVNIFVNGLHSYSGV